MDAGRRRTIGYVAVLAGCLLLALAAGWTELGAQIDNDAYDFLYRLRPLPSTHPTAIVLAIDETTLRERGGMRQMRTILADGIEALQATKSAAVAVDVILADTGDAQENARLAAVLRATPNLVLAADLDPAAGVWEDPLPMFREAAAAVGHAHADPDPHDNVTRQIPLEKAAAMDRRWALSLEAYRVWRGSPPILESPEDLEVGGVRIPAPRSRSQARPLLVRFQADRVTRVSIQQLLDNPGFATLFRDKVVFVGVTALSAADDRLMTPFSGGAQIPGVEIHAMAFQTLAGGQFLTPVSNTTMLLFCIALAAAAGLTFAYQSGWMAYLMGGLLLVAAHALPFVLFRGGVVMPYAAPVGTAWLCVAGAATYQHFLVRRQLAKSELSRSRYQQAIQFVTHEMRTPLTAIQGSSELMGRYNLPEEKSRQLAQMINSESRRLAGMIQTFLDVERLSEGQMELKRDRFAVATMIKTCVERVRPLAERKRISIREEDVADAGMVGDRELMEYAVYNLLNNAVKYSPQETEIAVGARRDGENLRLAVRDQGIGMDEAELRNIFQRFYRTRRAEASGEAGTGIGLSIVEQIVTVHGGRMEVTSRPGAGSCFTIVLPAAVAAAARPH